MRQKIIRISDTSKRIVAACIDGYLHNMKECLEKITKVKFDYLNGVAMLPVDGDPNGLVTSLDNQNDNHKVAISLLGKTSGNDYKRIWSNIHNSNNNLKLPSYYLFAKDRAAVEDVIITLDSTIDHEASLQENVDDDLVEEVEAYLVLPLNEETNLDTAIISISICIAWWVLQVHRAN